MVSWNEVKKYLPQYLNAESGKVLFDALQQFPDNIDSRLYETQLSDKFYVFQGDGLTRLPFIFFPDRTIHEGPAMILSNTCDNISRDNRYSPIHLIYAPIIKLSKFVELLRENGIEQDKIDNHISTIKKQYVTQIFYLPAGGGISEESLVFFDKINNCENMIEQEHIRDLRIFSLSNYGFYLLLLKISVHFTRIQEKVDRNMGVIF
jgi:hypothetical protein